MMRLMNILMLSCRKATELMEKKLHTPLGPPEKFQLFLHKQMCDGCRLYEKQSRFIHVLFKNKGKSTNGANGQKKTLPVEVKSKIIKELENI